MSKSQSVSLVNPFSGALVERDAASYTAEACDLFASRMSDDEAYRCEGGDTSAEWIVRVVDTLGPQRAGEIILS